MITVVTLLGTQLLLSSAAAAGAATAAATATVTDTNKLVSLSHLFRQQHLPPHRPMFHRHKDTKHHEKPDVAKMKLVNHHGNTSHLFPPVTNLVSSDDYHGNPEHAFYSTDSDDLLVDDKQLTEDDRQCVNEIRRTQWQPQQLSLTEQQVNDSRADSVLYEYHLSQPTKVSVDNTTLPTVHRSITSRRKTTNARMAAIQQQYKLPSPPPANPIMHANHQDILTTKQLFSRTTTPIVAAEAAATSSSIAQHKDRIAQAVELAANSHIEDTANSKVAEIRLVFDNTPSQQQQHTMAVPLIGGHKVDHWNKQLFTVNRPHTTDCGITGRPLLMRKPATRAGMRPIPENSGMLCYVYQCGMLCVPVWYVMCSSVATSGILCYVYQCGMLCTCVAVWYVMCSSVAISGILCYVYQCGMLCVLVWYVMCSSVVCYV